MQHRILIVDDSPRNLAILHKILGRTYAVRTAASGEGALAAAPEFHPDLVLLDIMMPGMDGYETCRRLRHEARLRDTKIIMVSAKALVSERLQGYQAGADDYVTKPFDEEELLAKIRVYLRLKSVESVERLRSDFLSLISHETRTPLTLILPPCEVLLADPSLKPEQREMLEMIFEGGRTLRDLVGKVSFLAALKSGHYEFELQTQDLCELLREEIRAIEPRMRQADVRLVAELPESLPLPLDRNMMQIAVRELLDNAMRHSPAGRAVTARLESAGEQALLTVRNEGPGISPEFLPEIFEAFAVEDVLHHQSASGTGLSLAGARLIVQGHEGSLSVESRRGAGATFRVCLPLGVPAELPVAT